MTDLLFSSWTEADDDPGWRRRGLVIAAFAAGGLVAGALSALLPGVDLRLQNVVQAGLSAALAAVPLSAGLARAGRRRDFLAMTLLSLGLAALGYVLFALQAAVIDAVSPSTFFWEGLQPRWYDPRHLAVAALATWWVFWFTWKVYLPAAVLTGWTVGFLLSRRLTFDITPAKRPGRRGS
jgi:hypothetical protein